MTSKPDLMPFLIADGNFELIRYSHKEQSNASPIQINFNQKSIHITSNRYLMLILTAEQDLDLV